MVEVTQLKRFEVFSMFSDLQLECLAKVAEIKALEPHFQVCELCKPSAWLHVDDVTQSRYALADVCLGDAEVLSINAEGLFDMWDVDPQIGHQLMRQLALLYLQLRKTAKLQVHEKLDKSTIKT